MKNTIPVISKRSIILTAILAVLLSSCYKDVYVLEVDAIDKVISYSGDIQPIFNNDCSTVGCHNAGSVKPFLNTGNSYQSLISGNYIDIDNPKNSELYQWMSGSRSLTMPISGVNVEYNAYILAWIEQGAKNN